MSKTILAASGLKWNPFEPELPAEAIWVRPDIERFCRRIQTQAQRGGFALVSGDPGTGKSTTLRLLAHRLEGMRDLCVRTLSCPSATISNFYRELGDLFGVRLSASNRWGGFKSLRELWQEHIDTTLLRPVLLVDEAQMMRTDVLCELRILTSADLDARSVLTVVLSGDSTLTTRFKTDALLPLGSRIRTRLPLGYLEDEDLESFLEHSLETAGNPRLMTRELKRALVEHAGGNLRTLTQLADDVLTEGLARELEPIDEKVFLDLCSPPMPTGSRKKRSRRSRS